MVSMDADEPIVQFYEHVRRAVIDGLTVVRNREDEREHFPQHRKFPVISYLDSGLPTFSDARGIFGNAPINFSDPIQALLLGDRGEDPDSWEGLWRFVCEDDRLHEHFDVERFLPDPKSKLESSAKIRMKNRLHQLIDHYIHITGLRRFRKNLFVPIFDRWARACYPEKVPVQFVVPIVVLDFQIEDRCELTASVGIERMSEEFQLSRAPEEHYWGSATRGVLGAATHALILSGWEVPNVSSWNRDITLSNIDALYPVVPHVERFFSALRIVTGFDTGYGQIITRPDGWCDRWAAHLESVRSAQARAFPERLEGIWMSTDRQVVTESDLNRVARVFDGLDESQSNRLAIASKRLNSAYLRREEDDSIIDICIGLEALFLGDGRAEITHKLATRLGALWSEDPALNMNPHEVFLATKMLYSYRSAVVHGSRKKETKRLIKPRPDKEVEALDLGLNLLRHSLEVIVNRPDLLKDGALDCLLLGGGAEKSTESTAVRGAV